MTIRKWQGWASVQTRIVALVVAATSLVVLGLRLSQLREARRIDAYLAADAREDGVLLDRALELEGASLATFAEDYTVWGEMVRFVQTPDSTWARVNLDNGIGTYRANAAWVFDPAGLQVYATRDSAMETAPEPVAPGVSVKDVFGGGHFCHFFYETPGGPIEIRGATIHPSDDDERKTPVRGYFLAARLWNKQYLAELTQLTGKSVGIEPTRAGAKASAEITRSSGEIRFIRPLPARQGSSEIALTASLKPEWIAQARRSGRELFMQLGWLALLAELLLTLVLWLWVTRPLGRLARSLESGTTEALKPLERSRTEFGKLARLVKQSFGQNAALVREVAERRQAEKGLKESEARFRAIFDNASDGMFLLEPMTRKFIMANRSCLSMLGYSEKEFLNLGVPDLHPEETLPFAYEQIGRFLKGETGIQADILFRRRDGSVFLADLSPAQARVGETDYVLVVFKDITERRRAEQGLAESEAKFRAIFDNASDGMFLFEPVTGKYTMVNRSCLSMLGYSEKEFLNLGVPDIVPEGTLPMVFEQIGHFLKGERVIGNDILFRRHDGSVFLTDLSPAQVRVGVTDYILVVFKDISERRQAEAALREAEKTYRDLVENGLVGVFRTTAKGVDEVLYANDTALRICGFKSFEEMTSLRTIVRYKNPGDEQAMMARLQATGRVTDFEFELRRKDGTSRNVVLNATLDGETLSGMLLDITERKQAEAAVEARSKELARSNADLQNFAFVASHDLQEPLRMVASYTQLLARRYQGKLDEKANKFIAYAVDGATRMQTLVNDLLTYARVGTRGKDPAPVDCEAALNQALANLKLTIKESGTGITHDPLPEVMGDDTQLVQLFQNLVGNAVKFGNAASPHVHISSTPADGHWQFSVKDNGIGIDPAQFERIFQIFQRLHGRSEYPGTGIGLALCKRIVERHGGRIWVESQPGQGSTFNFTLLRKEQTNG